ncbi:uncharacterized protein LOC120665972 isoform X4 [Panicum virgatum]|uniref:uncharacterized protein LOC120665972 isoform X4 n=1 Tax=Panicum virgatum TaxID=38727 RepID=UPI0019D5436C|nr:uncharacterized protein LOC120665972 isoform X4 [Panicum virgatum]
MATTEGLVPITRAYLARYYDKYPLAPLPDAATDLAARLRALSADLAAVTPIASVMTYMPHDFRGTLIRQQRERSERNKQAEVDTLVSAGGSIRDRYALLWKQQMERRVQLAQLGSATGVYKTLVRYLVGVPQVLLDFIRQINDDNGPMEEQRERYGPALYTLTKLVLAIRLYLHVSLARYEQRKIEQDNIAMLQQAVIIYTEEFWKFTEFIGEVFVNAPFFISAEDAGAMDARKSDEYKETIIQAGKTHEVILTVEAVNSYIAWDFSLQQGALNVVLDIGFHVEYISPSGEKTLILPYRRAIFALFQRDHTNLYGTTHIHHSSKSLNSSMFGYTVPTSIDGLLYHMKLPSNEDITHLDTNNIQGPITRARARQLNLEVSSFLNTSLYDYKDRLLPNYYIVIRNHGEGEGMLGDGLGGVQDQLGRPSQEGGPKQVGLGSVSRSRSSLH